MVDLFNPKLGTNFVLAGRFWAFKKKNIGPSESDEDPNLG